jgi:hypothetical protein
VQLLPTERHSAVPLQRFTPSTSTSQCCEQQSLFCAQVLLSKRQLPAGTWHTPPTQLSEQQSVLTVHGWW